MDVSFTRDEKRFVLAEIIKSSTVDVDTLLAFINANHVKPDWMSMQLPLGRNMNQCVKVVEHMGGSFSNSKRPSIGSQSEPVSRGTTSNMAGDMASPTARSTSPHTSNVPVPILPRPSDGLDASRSVTTRPKPSPAAQPKKRGRPSRADKAKRDLHPNLPPLIAPRIQHGTGHRPILPAAPRTPSIPRQPQTPAFPVADARQPKRRRLATPVGQSQQVNNGAFLASSAISSPAM